MEIIYLGADNTIVRELSSVPQLSTEEITAITNVEVVLQQQHFSKVEGTLSFEDGTLSFKAGDRELETGFHFAYIFVYDAQNESGILWDRFIVQIVDATELKQVIE